MRKSIALFIIMAAVSFIAMGETRLVSSDETGKIYQIENQNIPGLYYNVNDKMGFSEALMTCVIMYGKPFYAQEDNRVLDGEVKKLTDRFGWSLGHVPLQYHVLNVKTKTGYDLYLFRW